VKSVDELKKICVKPNVRDKTYFVPFRWLSWYVTGLICDLPISANQVTVFSFMLQLLGCVVLVVCSWPWNILSVLLIYLAFVFDCVDGNLARYRKQSSMGGCFLDSLGHSIIPALIILSVGIAAAFSEPSTFWAGIYFMCGFSASFFFMAQQQISVKKDYIVQKYGNDDDDVNGGGFSLVSLLAVPTFNLTEFILVAVVFNVLNWLIVFYALFIPLRYLGAIYFYFKALSEAPMKEVPE